MSIFRSESVDSVRLRDGWAVLSIHQFEPFGPEDDALLFLLRKLETMDNHVRSWPFQQMYHAFPVRLELVSSEPVPAELAQLCASRGVVVLGEVSA